MKRFDLAPEAEQDLDGIWEYIAENSISAADRFLLITPLSDSCFG